MQAGNNAPHLVDPRIVLHNIDHFGVNQNKDAARDPEQSVRQRREPRAPGWFDANGGGGPSARARARGGGESLGGRFQRHGGVSASTRAARRHGVRGLDANANQQQSDEQPAAFSESVQKCRTRRGPVARRFFQILCVPNSVVCAHPPRRPCNVGLVGVGIDVDLAAAASRADPLARE